ncbi:MAG: lysyl endopeptidase [Saprospiraceae bacterium]
MIDISRIYYAYDNDFEPVLPDNVYKVRSGFGDALACHTNINCPEGDDWQDHKRGVVRILRVFDEGMGWCSGSLINNTSQDETPYVLSAYHCYDGFTPQLDVWRFDFSYESVDCSNPVAEPVYNSMLGCNLRAGWSDTDVLLLELLQNVPGAYNARFNGWNRTLSHLPDTSTIIHHPRGDVKKISQDYDQASIHPTAINWSNGVTTPPNHHYAVYFDLGTFEDGSSGSNMLDEDGRIVGQLHGGNANCVIFEAFFGRFSLSWDEGPTVAQRLQEWLDPTGTGQLILDALEPVAGDMITINGNVKARTGQNMANVEVVATDNNEIYTIYTDANGNYSLEVPEGPIYTLSLHKDILAGNGVSTFDIVISVRHILELEEFADPLQVVAADANNSNSVSSIDLVRMRQVILGLNSEFPESESWRFLPSGIMVQTEDTVDFTGIKIGDPSGNANPN